MASFSFVLLLKTSLGSYTGQKSHYFLNVPFCLRVEFRLILFFFLLRKLSSSQKLGSIEGSRAKNLEGPDPICFHHNSRLRFDTFGIGNYPLSLLALFPVFHLCVPNSFSFPKYVRRETTVKFEKWNTYLSQSGSPPPYQYR